MILFTFSTILISFLLPLIYNPITLGLWIITLAIFVAISIIILTRSWLRFITFLIYIGGLLVIFAYFVAIDPNKKLKIIDPIILPTVFFVILLFSTRRFWLLPTLNSSSISNINTKILLIIQYSPILITIGITLLISLIAVVKITKRSQGSLRPYKQYV